MIALHVNVTLLNSTTPSHSVGVLIGRNESVCRLRSTFGRSDMEGIS
jgi:hypothetical protein